MAKKVGVYLPDDAVDANNEPIDDKEVIYHLRKMLDAVPADVYWKNVEGVWCGLNQRCAESLHRMGFIKKADISDIIGKTDHQIFDRKTADGYRKNDLEVMEKLLEITRKEETKLPNGRIGTLLSTKKPFLDDESRVIGIIGNTVDITKELESEEKAKKSEAMALMALAKAKTEEEMRKTVMVLVGDIVHDLRTPIATIRTITQLLDEMLPGIVDIVNEAQELGSKKINDINKRKYKIISQNRIPSLLHQAVVTMDDFINSSLMDLANAQKFMDEGEVQGKLIKCSSRRILENTFEAYVYNDEIKIHQDIAYDFFLMGNSILIMKILFNLISNASEQIAINGHGEIFITTKESFDYNLITVKDTAGGVDPEIESKLFTDYFTTKKNGTGIGLAYSKRTMAEFGGDLTFDNKHKGSVEFILSFPKI